MADVGKDLALLTAGTREKFNSLTIMYGAKGMIWGKNAYFAFIKPERFTWEFINSNNYFTVSYFPPELDYIHKIFGFKSGRYADKAIEEVKEKLILDKEILDKEYWGVDYSDDVYNLVWYGQAAQNCKN